MLQRILLAPLYKRANGGGCGVENIDLVTLDHVPETVRRRMIRRSLVHKNRRTAREWPVDNVAMPGNPPDVGRAPVNVVFLEIENKLCRVRDLREIPARRVKDPFRLSGGARSVKNV